MVQKFMFHELDLEGAYLINTFSICETTAYTGVNLPLEEFDCSRMEQDTGFRAEISFSEGCKKTRD